MIWIYAILSTLAVSAVSLIGVLFLSVKKETLSKLNFLLISFATGALFSGAFFHLIPEALSHGHNNHHHALMEEDVQLVSFYVLLGIFTFFVLEKIIIWRKEKSQKLKHIQNAGFVSLFADGFHNLIDGILIGSAFLVSPELGITTTLIVLLHEVPQEIGDFAILVHSGIKIKRALLYNLLSGLVAIIGVIIALIAGSEIDSFTQIIIPVSAGGFIYLAGSGLIPELHKVTSAKSGIIQIIAVIAGMSFIYLFTFLEHSH